MNRYSRMDAACNLEYEVDEHAHRYLQPAFLGDVEAAESLSFALDNPHRGYVAVRMWEEKVAKPAFRVFLSNVWDHHHHPLIAAAGTRRRLAAMFRYAAFPLPDLADTVQIWRGTCGITAQQASEGYSWTLDRDTACWFAFRVTGDSPVVVTAHIAKERIALFCDSRDESEIVLMKAPLRPKIDGNVDDWLQGRARRIERTTSRRNAYLQANQALAA